LCVVFVRVRGAFSFVVALLLALAFPQCSRGRGTLLLVTLLLSTPLFAVRVVRIAER
jgi:hypothetical protein